MANRSRRSSPSPARSSTLSSDRSDHRDARQTVLHTGLLLGFAIILLVALSACSFRPLYGQSGNSQQVSQSLSQIAVSAPGSKLGRQVEFKLLDLFSVSGNNPQNPIYQLTLQPKVTESNVAVRQDADVTRKNLLLRTYFDLKNVETGKTVFSSRSQARASYNRLGSEYANLVAAQDAQDRAAAVVADDIKLQLAVFFNGQKTP